MRWNFPQKILSFCDILYFTFQFKGTMMIDQNEIKSAFNHFVMGWHFITQKGLRRFVIMPILLNIVLLTGLFWLFVSQISTMIDWVMSFIPDWLSFFKCDFARAVYWLDSLIFLFCLYNAFRLYCRAV